MGFVFRTEFVEGVGKDVRHFEGLEITGDVRSHLDDGVSQVDWIQVRDVDVEATCYTASVNVPFDDLGLGQTMVGWGFEDLYSPSFSYFCATWVGHPRALGFRPSKGLAEHSPS